MSEELKEGRLSCPLLISGRVCSVAEFAKIPVFGPAGAGQRGGNIGMFRYHYS